MTSKSLGFENGLYGKSGVRAAYYSGSGNQLSVGVMSSGREDEEFMELGVQYYVAARSAAMSRLLPVCGNLFHHSLEMLLKAGLSRHLSLRDLQNRFRHRLTDIWPAFKAQFANTGELDQFDGTIAKVHEFEDIRYPEKMLKLGARMLVDWGATRP